MSAVAHLPGAGMPAPAPPRSRVRVPAWTVLDIEQARQFLMELDARTQGADLPRLAYLAGLAEGHLHNLLRVIDAVTEVN